MKNSAFLVILFTVPLIRAMCPYLDDDGSSRRFALHDQLMSAIITDTNVAINLLKKERLLVDMKDEEGNTPIAKAVIFENYEVIEFLLSTGVDPEAVSSTQKPLLLLAIEKGNKNLMQLLIRFGASIFTQWSGLPIINWSDGSSKKDLLLYHRTLYANLSIHFTGVLLSIIHLYTGAKETETDLPKFLD